MQNLILLALFSVSPLESESAFADRAKFDLVSQTGIVYLSLSDVTEGDREGLANTIKFVAASLSSKPNILQQLPHRVDGTNLMRLDLAELGWASIYQAQVIKNYPYRPDITAHSKSFPLVVSGLWFVACATDPNETAGMYYELLYSGKPPRTLKEFHEFWKVQSAPGDFVAFVEGQSGVAVQRRRLIENHPTGNRGHSWSTYDSKSVVADKDPLENLVPGTLKFDAGEHIAAIPKRATNASGTLQAYFLSDSKGNRQESAPASIVTDHLQTRTSEIRNFVSCVGCHATGINAPTVNEYSEFVTSGAKIYAQDKPTKEKIEAYLQSDFAKELTRANEDYAAAVKITNGMTPELNSAAFVKFVQMYDRDVDLAQAALELGVTEKTLSLSLAYYSAGKQPLPARLAGLAHGKAVPRKAWEQLSYSAWLMTQNFQKEK